MMPCFAIGDRPLERFARLGSKVVPNEVLSRTISNFRHLRERLFAIGLPDAVAESVAGGVGALHRG